MLSMPEPRKNYVSGTAEDVHTKRTRAPSRANDARAIAMEPSRPFKKQRLTSSEITDKCKQLNLPSDVPKYWKQLPCTPQTGCFPSRSLGRFRRKIEKLITCSTSFTDFTTSESKQIHDTQSTQSSCLQHAKFNHVLVPRLSARTSINFQHISSTDYLEKEFLGRLRCLQARTIVVIVSMGIDGFIVNLNNWKAFLGLIRFPT